MPDGSEIRYEVHAEEDGRWTIFTDAHSKKGTIAEGQNLLAGGKFSAAYMAEHYGFAPAQD